MSPVQPIIHNGQLAAVVVAGQAVVLEALSEADEQTVKAMCLYALEVAAGRQPTPYTDEQALAHAQRHPAGDDPG
jgi:hypothetical protein